MSTNVSKYVVQRLLFMPGLAITTIIIYRRWNLDRLNLENAQYVWEYGYYSKSSIILQSTVLTFWLVFLHKTRIYTVKISCTVLQFLGAKKLCIYVKKGIKTDINDAQFIN